jgi:hypothetical protein
MEPIALFIIDTVKDRPDLYAEWQALFDPITTLIGMSDDLGFTDVLSLWKEQGIADFKSWVSSTDNIYAIMELFNQNLRPPLISGNTGVSDKQGNPPMGWRFMGQRFTYDSYVHQQVCAPRLYVRDLVRGLDIMRAFGSNVADHIFAQTDYIEPESEDGGYQGGPELKRILEGYKTLHNVTDLDTPKRAIRAIEIQAYYREHGTLERDFPATESIVFGVSIDRDLRRRRISERLRRRLEQEDMVGEVRRLLEHVPAEDLIYYGLEYKFLTLYCLGRLSYDEMVSQLEIAIHQFAKRQMTWFRGMERRGIAIHWIDGTLPVPQQVESIIHSI